MGNKYLMKIRDIAEVFDGPHATPKKIDVGPYFLSISSLVNGQLDLSKSAHLSEEQFKKWTKRVTPQVGDVLFSYETRLGEAALMPAGVTACLGRRMGLLRPDKSKVLPEYLLYAYLSPVFQQEIKKRTIHGATVERISLRELPDFDIHIPEINTQRKVINTLNAINNKISLNKKANQTLEQMAQALFKSWFVDFDPVFDNLLASVDFKLENLENRLPDELIQKAQRRLAALNSLHNAAEIKASLIALAHELQAQLPTKEATQSAVQAAETPVKASFNTNPTILAQHANTHAYFPNEFELNEQLGWIPKGWEPSNLKEFGKVITGKTPPKKIDDAFDLEGIPFITPSDVEGDVFTLNVIRHLTESGVASVKNNIVEAESVCVTCIGSQMGKTTITPVKSVTNQQLNSIVLGEKYLRDYIFLNLRMRREELFNLGSSGSTMPILNKSSFENLSVLKPNEPSLKAFSGVTESYLAKILLNSQNNTKLTTMRDTLLPKLISGELQIPDVATDEEIVD